MVILQPIHIVDDGIGSRLDAAPFGDLADTTDALTRSRIVWAVFATCATFLFGAAGLGLYRGEFSAIQAVWAVVGPTYGGIATYFFAIRQLHSPEMLQRPSI
jgi:hypothetical protein